MRGLARLQPLAVQDVLTQQGRQRLQHQIASLDLTSTLL